MVALVVVVIVVVIVVESNETKVQLETVTTVVLTI